MKRFTNVPHHEDINLLDRCKEQLRDYDINYKGWVEPKDHTMSYLAAAYLELAEKYEVLTTSSGIGSDQALAEVLSDMQKFEAQMETVAENNEG